MAPRSLRLLLCLVVLASVGYSVSAIDLSRLYGHYSAKRNGEFETGATSSPMAVPGKKYKHSGFYIYICSLYLHLLAPECTCCIYLHFTSKYAQASCFFFNSYCIALHFHHHYHCKRYFPPTHTQSPPPLLRNKRSSTIR